VGRRRTLAKAQQRLFILDMQLCQITITGHQRSFMELAPSNRKANVRKKIALIIALMLSSSHAVARDLVEFSCAFSSFSDEERAKQSQDPEMRATYILERKDDGSYSGILTGNVGPVRLAVVRGPETFNLLEKTDAGILNMTTLQPDFSAGTAKAVHSRHIANPPMDLWMPSQWYGTCSIQ